MDTDDKGNIGVAKTELAVIELLGFKYRRQPISDYGIDAHIEIRHNENYPTGKLIEVQVKTDNSDCKEASDHYNFNFDYKHYYYSYIGI